MGLVSKVASNVFLHFHNHQPETLFVDFHSTHFWSLYLVLGMSQLRQSSGDRDLMLVVSHHVKASLSLRRTFYLGLHHNHFVFL